MTTIDYKIPKIEVTAEVALDNGLTLEVDDYIFYLDQFSRYRKGEETIFEYLNKKSEFIPLKKVRTGEFTIVNMSDIAYVKEKEKISVQCQGTLKLMLKRNFIIEVGHINPLPDSHARVLDYLNQDTAFLLFFKDDQRILISKNKITTVKEW